MARLVPRRLVVCCLSSLALSICFQQRRAYFQAAEVMIYKTEDESKQGLSECPEVMSMEDFKHFSPNKNAELYWSPLTEKSVRHAFFLGMIVSMLPAGIAADGFGAKGIMASGILISSILSTALPILAMMDPIYVMFGRFVQGVAQGLVIPCMNTILANWVPHNELTTYAALVHSGRFLGWGFGAIIVNRSESWRFDLVFSGLLGLCWVLLWVWLASSTPGENIYISRSELALISNNTKGIVQPMSHNARQYVPWAAIASSRVVFFLMLMYWAGIWLHIVTVLFQIEYFRHVLRLSRRLSTDITSLAEMCIFPSAIFWGIASDKCINHKFMSRATARKVFTVLPIAVSAVCLVCLPLVGCSGLAASSLYIIICFWRGLFLPNLFSNVVELSPRYAGLMGAIMWDTSTPIVVIMFLLVEYVCPQPSELFGWQMLNMISGVAMLLLALPYLYFGSADIQQWNFFTKARSSQSQMSRIHDLIGSNSRD